MRAGQPARSRRADPSSDPSDPDPSDPDQPPPAASDPRDRPDARPTTRRADRASSRSGERRTRWIELDGEPLDRAFERAVRDGLTADRDGRGPCKTLPSHLLYDETGSRLFEAICELPEYYLTRAENEILEATAADLARRLPEIQTLVELGSGSATKTEHLLRAFEADGRQLTYAPIDVSRSALEESVARLETRHPELRIVPAVAEYDAGLGEIHALGLEPMLTLWLGSSIGNLRRPAAADFLSRLRARMAPDDRLLVGIDLRKDRAVLEAAYDDAQGVTARFDLNLLTRINRELDADFDLERFRHRVHYDAPSGSVQSFLESLCDQRVRVGGLDLEVRFRAGERIHTEDSHKYSLEEIDALAAEAGLSVEGRELDRAGAYSLNLFRSAPA